VRWYRDRCGREPADPDEAVRDVPPSTLWVLKEPTMEKRSAGI
jgi:hypothetical protein